MALFFDFVESSASSKDVFAFVEGQSRIPRSAGFTLSTNCTTLDSSTSLGFALVIRRSRIAPTTSSTFGRATPPEYAKPKSSAKQKAQLLNAELTFSHRRIFPAPSTKSNKRGSPRLRRRLRRNTIFDKVEGGRS